MEIARSIVVTLEVCSEVVGDDFCVVWFRVNDEELVGKVLTCKGVLEGGLGKMEHDSALFTSKMRKNYASC